MSYDALIQLSVYTDPAVRRIGQSDASCEAGVRYENNIVQKPLELVGLE